MATYKTKDGQDYLLPGIGRTVGGQITTDQVIENPLFIEIETPVETPKPDVAQAPVQPIQNTPSVPPAPVQQPVAPAAVQPTTENK